MRINEDFIDQQDVNDVITSDDEPLSMKYPYYFFFTTKDISRRLPPNLCIQMMSKFCSMFTRMVAGLPAVKHFNKDDFQIYMGGSYLFKDPDGRGGGKHPYEPFIYYSYSTVELPGGFELVFSDEDNVVTLEDYFHNKKGFTPMNFGFFINIDADMENISRIHKMWLTLWSIFEKALKFSFDYWCEPEAISYYTYGANISRRGNPYIISSNLETWKGESMKSAMMSKLMLTNVLCKYHPELDFDDAERQVKDYLSSLNA